MLHKFIHISQNFMSLVKFSHTIFALPFAFIGFTLAISEYPEKFSFWLLLAVLLCMVFARNAAMAFNRWADRNIDIKNPRTAQREIPAQKISSQKAKIFILLNGILFIITTYFINSTVFYLSPIALLVILGYSYTKRFTWMSHLILGLGLSLAPIGAYLAVTGSFSITPILISGIVLFWVSGFDIIYALQDTEFDKSQNLKSIPVFLGKKNALLFSTFLHIISAVFVVSAAYLAQGSYFFWSGAIIFTLLLFYQHLLVKPNDLSKVNLAFFTTNGFASVAFAVLVITDLLIR